MESQRALLPLETTTGSGQGATQMNVRTIIKELQREMTLIGQGRFGTVYLAKYRQEPVAVKYFRPDCEDSFRNETNLMHKTTVNLRDVSIVGFIGLYKFFGGEKFNLKSLQEGSIRPETHTSIWVC